MRKEYFEWLVQLVCIGHYKRRKMTYRYLLRSLHEIPFTYENPLDENRLIDGLSLRSRFGIQFMSDPCSVLEMMVALAYRMEESIMHDDDIGNRRGEWFWGMIESLGLSDENDANFHDEKVRETIIRFLKRDYEADGHGGLFTIPGITTDLRDVEIWYQMSWYLSSILER